MNRNMSKDNTEINIPLLKEIMQLQFAVIETVLYLDTHPFDKNVLNLQNEYSARLENKIKNYSKKYGPLANSYPEADYPWSWINEPWPWQIEY